MAVEDPFTARSKPATATMLAIAATACGATLWYLWPGLPDTLIAMIVAALLLVVPLAARWPITPRRAATSAAVWLLVGLPGSYVFGTAVMYASVPLALSVASILLVTRMRRPSRQIRACGKGVE